MSNVKICDICGNTIECANIIHRGGYLVPNKFYKTKVRYTNGQADTIEWCYDCMKKFIKFVEENKHE